MKIIPIKYKNNIYNCLVDENVYEYLSQFYWQYRCGYSGRMRRKKDLPGNRWVHFHREVLRLNGIIVPEGMIVDHINRNKMDNRLENLRVTTRAENAKNISEKSKIIRRNNALRNVYLSSLKPRTLKQLNACSETAKKINSLGLNIHKGEKNSKSKKVIDTLTGKIYVCIREAAQLLNINYSTLKNKLNGNLKNNTTLRFLEE